MPKFSSETLNQRDSQARKECGWSQTAFIAPSYPTHMPKEWSRALKFMQARHPRTYMMHVYEVLELLVEYAKESANAKAD